MHYSQKSIRSFVIRSGKGTAAQKQCYQRLAPQYCLQYQNFAESQDTHTAAAAQYWQPLLQGKSQFLCEIGFGTGSSTWQIVRQNPSALYLGIEVYRNGVAALLQKAEQYALDNLRIIEHDALEVLENMLPCSYLDGLHIFFPDPWPKRSHQKRRIINKENLLLFYKNLKPGGYLYFITDWQDYAESVRKMITQQAALWHGPDNNDAYSLPQDWRPQSKFEAKAHSEGRPCFELYLHKK